MYKNKQSTRTLTLLLAGIVLVSVIMMVFSHQSDRSFKRLVIKTNAEKISSFSITPSNGDSTFQVVKSKNGWVVPMPWGNVEASNFNVEKLLRYLDSGIESDRLVAKHPTQWANFGVSDSLATHIIAYRNNKEVANFYCGGFEFEPQTRRTWCYIRLAKNGEVYSIDGILSMSLNRTQADFRNNDLLNVNPKSISKIEVEQADSSYTIERTNNKLIMNGIECDSVKAEKFMHQVSKLATHLFANCAHNQLEQPFAKATITTNDNTVTITAYKVNGKTVLESTANNGNLFSDDRLNQILFTNKKNLLP